MEDEVYIYLLLTPAYLNQMLPVICHPAAQAFMLPINLFIL